MEHTQAMLEQKRNEYRNSLLVFGALLLIGLLTVIFYVGIVFIAGGVAYYFLVSGKKKAAYQEAYKEIMVFSALEEAFTEVRFAPSRGLPKEVVEGARLVQSGNRYASDDYICAKYKGVPFRQADVCIEMETHHTSTDANGHTTTHTTVTTYFKGRWMIFDFNKDFTTTLHVADRRFGYYAGGGRGRLSKIALEDIRFNKEYRIYGDSQHEAYYILTPAMMENIRALNEQTAGQLLLCFMEGKLHVAVNNGQNAFEPPLFGRFDFEKERAKVLAGISCITRFVDGFSLDRNLFKLNADS
ncbi:MAG: DUF3137 domain-containing protein [Clostridiales bacterium]|nr:DUF3137 domain-containing protein [Clostridiales bacterium]